MSKEDAEDAQKKKKEKEKKDSRHLHLAVEGSVRKGTQAAIGVSEADLQKRVQVEKWKRGMLKDLNMFISPYRYCLITEHAVLQRYGRFLTIFDINKWFLKLKFEEIKMIVSLLEPDVYLRINMNYFFKNSFNFTILISRFLK